MGVYSDTKDKKVVADNFSQEGPSQIDMRRELGKNYLQEFTLSWRK